MRVKYIPLAMSAGLALACLQAGAGFFPARHSPDSAPRSPAKSHRPRKARWRACWSAPRRPAPIITVTVVSDKDGRYSFPATRLEPGGYTIRVRAVGYELTGKPSAQIGPTAGNERRSQAAQDRESSRPSSRMANGSSARPARSSRSTPTTLRGCHTLERVLRSQHDADDFVDVAPRMAGYANQCDRHCTRSCDLRQRLLEERGDAARARFPRPRRIPCHRQSERGRHLGVPAQDAAAPDRALDPRHHHRVRPAARDHPAARCDRR